MFDSVIFNLPYMLYKFRGDTEGIRICANAMVRYLSYIVTQRSEDGTVKIGLGDWVPVGKITASDYTHPLGLCHTVMVMDMAHKASEMLAAIGQTHQARFAKDIYRDMRNTVRRVYLDPATCALAGGSQTGQAMGLYYGVFEPDERYRAFARLLECIHANGDNFDCDFVGMHCLFHVLSEFGETALAYHMITKPDYPSYAHFIEVGETSIPEKFMPDDEWQVRFSHNHHFLCDISRWFIFHLAGLRVIDRKTVEIAPRFLPQLEYASAYHILPAGRVSAAWKRVDGNIRMEIEVPRGVTCRVKLPDNISYRIKRI